MESGTELTQRDLADVKENVSSFWLVEMDMLGTYISFSLLSNSLNIPIEQHVLYQIFCQPHSRCILMTTVLSILHLLSKTTPLTVLLESLLTFIPKLGLFKKLRNRFLFHR